MAERRDLRDYDPAEIKPASAKTLADRWADDDKIGNWMIWESEEIPAPERAGEDEEQE